jgi:hypothetical protein
MRKRPRPHTFEENFAAEKARLEALVATIPNGPAKDGLLKKIRQLETAAQHQRVAFIARTAASGAVGKVHWP